MTFSIKTLLKSAALGVAVISMPAVMVTPASAQSKNGIAIANYQAAVVKSQAYQTAVNQMKVTYKADIDASNARAAAIQTELKPLVDAYNAAVQAPGATAASIQPQAQALQAKRQSAQQELTRLQARVNLATAYVEEQVGAKLNDAIVATMKAKNIDLVLQPQAVIARENHVDITDAIVLELNKLVPSASITPPAGWQPGQQNQQQAAQPAPAAAQPTGR